MSVIGEDKCKELYPMRSLDDYQPNSVDLRLGAMYEILDTSIVGLMKDNEKYLPNVSEIECEDGVYTILPKETLLVEVTPKMEIPANVMQLYFPRSSLMRMGLSLQTCVGDSGFYGGLMFLLTNHSGNVVTLARGERFATAVSFTVKGAGEYDGSYQER